MISYEPVLEESETALTKVLLILERWKGSANTQRGSETLTARGVLFIKHQQINHGFPLALIENVMIFFLFLGFIYQEMNWIIPINQKRGIFTVQSLR